LLKRSIDQLEAIGAPFMGCVLNDITADASSAYGYSYYYYRYRYDSDDGPDGPQQLAS
jgi:Mrp family chromosome partitioning ATPase